MPPVERAIPLHHGQHGRRIHPVPVLESPALEMGYEVIEDRRCQFAIAANRRQERAIDVGRQRVATEKLGVGRTGIHQRPSQHPHEGLVGLLAMFGERRDGLFDCWHPGLEFGERRRSLGHATKPVDGLGRRATRRHVSQELLHVAGEPGLVVPVLLVRLAGDLVVVEPAELHLQLRGLGIERDALVPQQRDPPTHPAPAFLGHLRRRRDVVGEVPGLEAPHLLEPRLQRGDPLAQCLSLKKLPFGLQVVGPRPEHIDCEPAKRAERCSGDRHVGRHTLRSGTRNDQFQVAPLPLDTGRKPDRCHRARNEHAGGDRDHNPVGVHRGMAWRGIRSPTH